MKFLKRASVQPGRWTTRARWNEQTTILIYHRVHGLGLRMANLQIHTNGLEEIFSINESF